VIGLERGEGGCKMRNLFAEKMYLRIRNMRDERTTLSNLKGKGMIWNVKGNERFAQIGECLDHAMETREHSKNWASQKSLTSRGNLMKMIVLFCIMICLSGGMLGQVYKFEIKGVEGRYRILYDETITIDVGKGEISQTRQLEDSDFPIGMGKYKIVRPIGEVTIDGQRGIAYYIENISERKTDTNDNDQIGIYEDRVLLQTREEKGTWQFPFKSGDGNAAVFRRLRQEQFSGNTTITPATPAAPIGTQAKIDEYLKKKDATEGWNSMYWYEKAAELGDEKSQTVMAIFYELGHLVPKDGSTALYWYEKCLSNENFSGNRESLLKSVGELKAQGYTARQTTTVSRAIDVLIKAMRYNLGGDPDIAIDKNTALYLYEVAVKNEDGSINDTGIEDAKYHIKNLKEQGYSSSRSKIK
jgi:hypothetical protein